MNYFSKKGQSHLHLSVDDLQKDREQLKNYLVSIQDHLEPVVLLHLGDAEETTSGLLALAVAIARHLKENDRTVKLIAEQELVDLLRPLGFERMLELKAS
ncbi:MAG TPA: hypothetical protein PKE49_09680 [Leptospiraceae bacterium]|nr:hypothetical protein [Leptospirales bacterium]HMU82703.1 hypothetical protein [Leptospiraceae bacterium]HMW61243.1 hypothetical protein [Leptospiraceae bacterium]HMX56781.1 hypothetical protein [Leptospiraceae bacterium]HMY44577.1 hypothetical protein [Leptospiraceae bacterium]